jgi:hypothetical protein
VVEMPGAGAQKLDEIGRLMEGIGDRSAAVQGHGGPRFAVHGGHEDRARGEWGLVQRGKSAQRVIVVSAGEADGDDGGDVAVSAHHRWNLVRRVNVTCGLHEHK